MGVERREAQIAYYYDGDWWDAPPTAPPAKRSLALEDDPPSVAPGVWLLFYDATDDREHAGCVQYAVRDYSDEEPSTRYEVRVGFTMYSVDRSNYRCRLEEARKKK